MEIPASQFTTISVNRCYELSSNDRDRYLQGIRRIAIGALFILVSAYLLIVDPTNSENRPLHRLGFGALGVMGAIVVFSGGNKIYKVWQGRTPS